MTFATKDEALDALEIARAEYLAKARLCALRLTRKRDTITVDDVREKCPPPEDIDPRVMGAIFAGAEWEAVGFVNSARRACHRRPVRMFRRAA